MAPSCGTRLALAAALVFTMPAAAAADAPPAGEMLVVLSDTGTTCDGGLPRLTRHPDAARHLAVLTRGFSGRLLRLYRNVQVFRQRNAGTPVEPAYLLLSATQGGFPRFGFCLDAERKPSAGYVDLHRGGRLSGAFGAMDQIFPHELLHVLARQLSGVPPDGGSNQVHAIGLRTDRYQAFDEGFAEHAQVMAVDDADAMPETRALATDETLRSLAWNNLRAYRRSFEARWSLAPRHRLGFAFWFGGTEQTLRYWAVKDNLFAHEPDVPRALLTGPDPWPAYLLENSLPGTPESPVKVQPRLAATEGVVAAIMVDWLAVPETSRGVDEAGFYDAFGADADALTPLEQAYLKIFRVMADEKPHDLIGLARAYARRFPEEAGTVESLLSSSGIDPARHDAEIWLATRRFRTGTTLYDQYRGLPRPHTFDLNAASPVDLATVPGLDASAARDLLAHRPYASLEAAIASAGLPLEAADELRQMARAFVSLSASPTDADTALNLWAVFWPTIWRAGLWVAVGSLAGTWLYRWRRALVAWRLVLNGLAASLVGLLAAWVVDAPWWFAPAVPLVLFAGPAVLWQFGRGRWQEGLRVGMAWLLAVLPVVLISQPMG